jgi:hypothetical protein
VQLLYQLQAACELGATMDDHQFELLDRRCQSLHQGLGRIGSNIGRMQQDADQGQSSSLWGTMGLAASELGRGGSKMVLGGVQTVYGEHGPGSLASNLNTGLEALDNGQRMVSKVLAGDQAGGAVDGLSLDGGLANAAHYDKVSWMSQAADAAKLVQHAQTGEASEAAVDLTKLSSGIAGHFVSDSLKARLERLATAVDGVNQVHQTGDHFSENLETRSQLGETTGAAIAHSQGIYDHLRVSADHLYGELELLKAARDGTLDEKITQVKTMLAPESTADDPAAYDAVRRSMRDYLNLSAIEQGDPKAG